MPLSSKTRRRTAIKVGAVLLLLVLAFAAFPWPVSPGHVMTDSAYAKAIGVSYWFVVRNGRPSGVPLNGLTYTVVVGNSSRDEIEVVFLPRLIVQQWKKDPEAEEIHVIVQRQSKAVVRAYFAVP